MKLNQNGSATGLTIAVIVLAVLFVASAAFGAWSFSGRQKYKNNADQLINTAVAQAKTEQESSDSKAFYIKQENPLIEYIGPQSYGTINLWYPRNWSSYVNVSGNAGFPVDGYFFPGTLPTVTDNGGTNFALRIQVENEAYNQVLQTFNGEVANKQATVTAYALPKMPSVVGVEIVGTLESGVSGTLVILPLRTESLEVWTEGTAYLSEFNSDILPNLSFSP